MYLPFFTLWPFGSKRSSYLVGKIFIIFLCCESKINFSFISIFILNIQGDDMVLSMKYFKVEVEICAFFLCDFSLKIPWGLGVPFSTSYSSVKFNNILGMLLDREKDSLRAPS